LGVWGVRPSSPLQEGDGWRPFWPLSGFAGGTLSARFRPKRKKLNGLTENLATKDELFATKQDLQGDINLLRADMNGEFTLVRSEMAAMEERLEGKIALVRSDMGAMEERLEGKIDSVEERLRGEIAVVRTDMADMQVKLMRYMTTLVLGSGGLIIAAMKLLP
jgi:hypothetical protein